MNKLFLLFVLIGATFGANAPWQLHLGLTGDPSEILANWVTNSSTPTTICVYGIAGSGEVNTVTGYTYTYPDGGFKGVIHTAIMTELVPGKTYAYQCGCSQDGLSQQYTFRVRGDKNQNFVVGNIGDMGIVWADGTFKYMTRDAKTGLFDMILNVGDISYADDYPFQENFWVNDEYMSRMEPIAATAPHMTCPGNHDTQYNYAAYRNRFQMPGNASLSNSSLYYSFDYNSVHFVGINTEESFAPGSTQYKWLIQDLERATANRQNVPWIIVFGHRPFYCSNLITGYISGRCSIEGPLYRSYLESVFKNFSVDIYISGHNHAYERSYPTYNGKRTDGTSYDNPTGTVYIVNGAAGDPEYIDPTFVWPAPEWRGACRPFEFGYGRMLITSTSLRWQFVNDADGEVSDDFTITKTN